MTLLEDINSGKYNLVLILILFLSVVHLYWSKSTEHMADVSSVSVEIKEAIKQIYNADVQAIRNLSEVATKLQAGGLTIPGNLKVTGSLEVSSNSTVIGDSMVKGKFNYLPTGTIVIWTGTTPPEGWALCDGITKGTPDLRGRFVLGLNPSGGKDAKVPGDDYKIINGKGGEQIHQLSPGEMPSHKHTMSYTPPIISFKAVHYSNSGIIQRDNGNIQSNTTDTHSIDNAGGNEFHNNMPPYYVLAYIMKL